MNDAQGTLSGDYRAVPGLPVMLAEVAEACVGDPERLEGVLQGMVHDLRVLLGLRSVELVASMDEGSLRISISDGDPEGALAEEFPIARGKIQVGLLKAYPAGLEPGVWDLLRAAAGMVALALDAAHSRELAARRAAQGSIVQLASEALGAILDEGELYRTVLVLALELLGASGGAVLPTYDAAAVAVGFEDPDGERRLAALREIRPSTRVPFRGSIGGRYVVGVGLGEPGDGAVFLEREDRPYAKAEGVSLKLVARQLARARERSGLYASQERTTIEAIGALAAALESRDGTTGEHIQRTEALAERVARAMGLGAEEVRTARYAAVLHDIGKIGVPDSILNKPSGLNEAEWSIMRRHPEVGARIVGGISGFGEVAEAIGAHHERPDGRGYPKGLAGGDIPVAARVIAAVDSYDAMTNDRPYRAAMRHEAAAAELYRGLGTQFDPEVVRAVMQVFDGEEPQR